MVRTEGKIPFSEWIAKADRQTIQEYKDLGFYPKGGKSEAKYYKESLKRQAEYQKKYERMTPEQEAVELEKRFERINNLFRGMDGATFELTWRDLESKDPHTRAASRISARNFELFGILVAPTPDSDDGQRARFVKPRQRIDYQDQYDRKSFTSYHQLTEENNRQIFTVEEPTIFAKIIDSKGAPHFQLLKPGWLEPVAKS